MKLPVPALAHAFDLMVDLGPITEIGEGRGGQRRFIPILGGTVRGPRLNGHILNVGADWQTVHRDGLAWIDTRYAFQTHDGAVIEIINQGYRYGPAEVMARVAAGEPVDPADYTMRTVARLETGHSDYSWVNRTLFVGTGGRFAQQVRVALYAVE